MDTEVLFNVEEAEEGGYVATAPSHGIVTQADSIEELRAQVRDAVACHFDAGPATVASQGRRVTGAVK